ncbi:MAG: hypothetical protein D6732_23595 [Methanobacteriota archaeon]|nr:MAG: hypothetical protein D6732_23595 [Euryarchaeota archaeon]
MKKLKHGELVQIKGDKEEKFNLYALQFLVTGDDFRLKYLSSIPNLVYGNEFLIQKLKKDRTRKLEDSRITGISYQRFLKIQGFRNVYVEFWFSTIDLDRFIYLLPKEHKTILQEEIFGVANLLFLEGDRKKISQTCNLFLQNRKTAPLLKRPLFVFIKGKENDFNDITKELEKKNHLYLSFLSKENDPNEFMEKLVECINKVGWIYTILKNEGIV